MLLCEGDDSFKSIVQPPIAELQLTFKEPSWSYFNNGTALYWASQAGRVDVAKYLIKRGAIVDDKSKQGAYGTEMKNLLAN